MNNGRTPSAATLAWLRISWSLAVQCRYLWSNSFNSVPVGFNQIYNLYLNYPDQTFRPHVNSKIKPRRGLENCPNVCSLRFKVSNYDLFINDIICMLAAALRCHQLFSTWRRAALFYTTVLLLTYWLSITSPRLFNILSLMLRTSRLHNIYYIFICSCHVDLSNIVVNLSWLKLIFKWFIASFTDCPSHGPVALRALGHRLVQISEWMQV